MIKQFNWIQKIMIQGIDDMGPYIGTDFSWSHLYFKIAQTLLSLVHITRIPTLKGQDPDCGKTNNSLLISPRYFIRPNKEHTSIERAIVKPKQVSQGCHHPSQDILRLWMVPLQVDIDFPVLRDNIGIIFTTISKTVNVPVKICFIVHDFVQNSRNITNTLDH